MGKRIWTCTIGEADDAKVPGGADAPMRQAIADAYFKLTGERPQFIFSGWAGELSTIQRRIVDGE